jgi:hypothetical protein
VDVQLPLVMHHMLMLQAAGLDPAATADKENCWEAEEQQPQRR